MWPIPICSEHKEFNTCHVLKGSVIFSLNISTPNQQKPALLEKCIINAGIVAGGVICSATILLKLIPRY